MEKYSSDVKLVWKHQPLPNHKQAFPAAEAAEAAREQGKFWEMHDLIFANQTQINSVYLLQLATRLKLNLEKFQQSIKDHKNQKRIEEDAALAKSVNVTGTPTFYINGRLLVGSKPFERFDTLIQQEIAQANKLLKSGRKLDSSFYDTIVAENKKMVVSR